MTKGYFARVKCFDAETSALGLSCCVQLFTNFHGSFYYNVRGCYYSYPLTSSRPPPLPLVPPSSPSSPPSLPPVLPPASFLAFSLANLKRQQDKMNDLCPKRPCSMTQYSGEFMKSLDDDKSSFALSYVLRPAVDGTLWDSETGVTWLAKWTDYLSGKQFVWSATEWP